MSSLKPATDRSPWRDYGDKRSRRIHIACDVTFNEEAAENFDEESCKRFSVNLDFGNYNESLEEDEEDFESAESSGEENDEVSPSISDRQQDEVRQTGRQLRDRRTLRVPDRYSEFGYASIADVVPQTYESAVSSVEAVQWKCAMNEEMSALRKNKTWTLERLPENKKTVACKWVFTKKLDSNGNVERYKARLVAKGFTQREGIDFSETFAPVVRYESVRILLAIAERDDFELAQFDIKTAFLYGELKELIFMEQPQGFVDKSQPLAVCKLK